MQVVAPIAALSRVRGSWWRPGGFSFEVGGKRHKAAASMRGGPDGESSGWFTDFAPLDMILLALYIVLSPLIVVYLVRTRRRWLRILRGRLDPAPLAEKARADNARTAKALSEAQAD